MYLDKTPSSLYKAIIQKAFLLPVSVDGKSMWRGEDRSKIYAREKAYSIGKIFWTFEKFYSSITTEKGKQEVAETV